MSHALAIRELTVPTIEALALRAQQGERDCFDEIVRRIRPRLHAFLIKRVGTPEDADDLVQETLVRALANLARYDSGYRFSTWLYTIASNLAASHHRSKRHASDKVDVIPAAVDTASSIAERDAGTRLWQRAHKVLPPAHYAVLWLRYAQDFSVKEIAAQTGRTSIHVRVLLYRARRSLATEVV